jgi:hypothetical protein
VNRTAKPPIDRERLAELERTARRLARVISASIPPDAGFCLNIFATGNAPESTYVSNCCREDVIAFLREFVDTLARGGDHPPYVLSRKGARDG